MQVFVTVVAHEHDDILPVAGIGIRFIGNDLVDHRFGIIFRHHGKPSHADVELVLLHRVESFAVVEESEKAVVHIAMGLAKGILALESQQEVIGIQGCTVGSQHPVVPHTVAKQQQRLGQVLLVGSPVIEHLHVAAIGIGIGRAAGKLVVELVGRHDVHPQTVVRGMEVGQPLCLCQQMLARRNDNHQIGGAVGMMVLIHNAIEIFRLRKVSGR